MVNPKMAVIFEDKSYVYIAILSLCRREPFKIALRWWRWKPGSSAHGGAPSPPLHSHYFTGMFTFEVWLIWWSRKTLWRAKLGWKLTDGVHAQASFKCSFFTIRATTLAYNMAVDPPLYYSQQPSGQGNSAAVWCTSSGHMLARSLKGQRSGTGRWWKRRQSSCFFLACWVHGQVQEPARRAKKVAPLPSSSKPLLHLLPKQMLSQKQLHEGQWQLRTARRCCWGTAPTVKRTTNKIIKANISCGMKEPRWSLITPSTFQQLQTLCLPGHF